MAGVRYYGYYSNKSRGLRKKAGTDDQVPALIDSDISPQAFRKNWARLIQKIYNVNPLLCAKCSGSMRIISLIDDAEIIKKILKHLDLWDVKRKPPPCANPPQADRLSPLLSMIIPQSPARMIRLRSFRHDKFHNRFCFLGLTRPPSDQLLRRDTLLHRC